MGFNFDKSSQDGGGGGKVFRKPWRHIQYYDDFGGEVKFAFNYVAPPTYPQWHLYNSWGPADEGVEAWTYTQTQDTSASLSVGSTYWINLLAFNLGGFAQVNSLVVNGSTIKPAPQMNFGYVALDVYGYGVSATMYADANNTMVIAPMVPRTHITESGSVVWPPRLTGKSVYRDV